MIFKLNLNFVYGANLSAKLLNKIVNKLNEIGGLVGITFNDGNPLCADDLNLIIDTTNNLILDDWNLPKLDNLSDGEYLCADVLNRLVYIINEIIKHINLKDDIYDLKVLIYSDTSFTYKGGLFILDAYITKNGKYYTREGIEFISSLVNNNGIFNIPEVVDATNYTIEINSEYGNLIIELTQTAKQIEEEATYEIYVSEYPHAVSADGGEVEIVVSILKNGKNYTTLGLNVDIQYPYKISSVYKDNGVERVYLFKFEPNISFDLKNLIGTVSAISLESKLINIIQPCQDVDSVIRVHANGSRVIPYNTTEVSFSFYAVVNRKTVDSGVIPEIVSNEVDAVLKNSTNSTATYTISENTGETDRKLILLASYQGVKSGKILIIQRAKSYPITPST